MGSKLGLPAFLGETYGLPAVPGQPLHSANICYQAESRRLPDHAEGQDVTRS